MRYISLIILLISSNCYSQISDTIYFDKDWNHTTEGDYSYYLIYERTDTLMKIVDYYKNGICQNTFYAEPDINIVLDVDVINKKGPDIIYDKRGRKKRMSIYKPLIYSSLIKGFNFDSIYPGKDFVEDLIYWEYYYKNGKVKYNGFSFDECTQHLTWRYFDKKGRIWLEMTYDYGLLIRKQTFHLNGKISIDKYYVNGEKKRRKKYNYYGYLKNEKLYENGKKKKIVN